MFTLPAPPAVFALDLRSLALFRFCLGLLVSLDCWARLADVGAFYSDGGVLPRALLLAEDPSGLWSLAYLQGSSLFQASLLVLGALAGAALAFGYHTRRALLVVWVVLISMQTRNPLVLIEGDRLLLCLLFWSLWVPLAARWSLDAALSPRSPPSDHRHLSWGGAALLVQLLSAYLFAAALKQDPAWWPDGRAVHDLLELDRLALPLGQLLREIPGWHTALSYGVYGLEWAAPFLVLAPWATQTLRHVALVLLGILQLGLGLTLALGLHSWVNLAALTLLLGPALWDRLGRRKPVARPLRIYYDEDCGFCHKSCRLLLQMLILPRGTEILPAQQTPRARALMEAQWSWVVIDHEDVAHLKWAAMVALIRSSRLLGWSHRVFALPVWNRPGDAVYDWVAEHRGHIARWTAPLLASRDLPAIPGPVGSAFAAGTMVLVLVWQCAGAGWLPSAVGRWLSPPLQVLHLDARWTLFAPAPPVDDGWFVMPGRLEDGRRLDLMTGVIGPVRYDKPTRIATDAYENARWRGYLYRLWQAPSAAYRASYARYRCEQWNRSAPVGQRLSAFQMEYMLETTPAPGGDRRVERRVIWRQDCLPPSPPVGPDAENVEGLDDGHDTP